MTDQPSPDFPASSAVSAAPEAPSAPPPGTDPVATAVPHLTHLLEAATSLVTMVVFALFVLTFVAQPFRIPSASMTPTLLVGDFLLVNKMTYAPAGAAGRLLPYRDVAHGDVIVFHYPPDPRIHVVKRVIGLPGDRIRLVDGTVFLNGKPQQESYTAPLLGHYDPYRDQFPASLYTDPGVDPRWWMQLRREVRNGEYTVPSNSYFVLGDNRGNSRDSRYWGLVPKENIVGRPFLVYFSLRGPSIGDVSTLPDDKLGYQNDKANSLRGFARWGRTFLVVR